MWAAAANFVLFATIAVAVWLVVELIPRRRGQTPHCRRCRYNLTGMTVDDAARCPECGAPLANRGAIVPGELRFRPRRLATAAILLVLAVPISCTLVYARMTDLDWRRTAPSWVLLHLLRGAWPVDEIALLRERDRRYSVDDLDRVERGDLADICLVHHGAAQPPPATLSLAADMLGKLLLAGELSPAQQQRFLDNTLVMSTSVRQPLVTGMNAQVQITYVRRLSSKLTMTVQLCNRTLDGQPCAMLPGPSSWRVSECAADGQFEQVLICPAAGQHDFSVDADVTLGESSWPPQSPTSRTTPIILRTRRTLTARVEVMAGDPATHVRAIETPAALEAAQALHVAVVLHRPAHSLLEVSVALLEPSAVWMVFAGRMEFDDRVIELGSVSLEPNAELRVWALRAEYEGELPPTVAVELRPDPVLARREALAGEFFGGPLRFDAVPVVREQAAGGFYHPVIGWIRTVPAEPECPD